jgi:dTDP-glucose 4,6-dehydratase
VLVTGAAGFLGSHLSEYLIAEGHSVLGIDNLITGRTSNLARLANEPRFEFRLHNVCEPFEPGEIAMIFHMASPASPVDYMRWGVETMKTGSIGTNQVLETAHRHGATFLMASTSECYGDPLENPQRESYWGNVNPIGPRSVYDEAKRFSEALTMAYLRYLRVDTRIVRIFNTYGPRLRPNDGRVISNFVSQALLGEDITIYGSGQQTRSFCYVSDLIEGIVRLSRSGEHEPVNIGNPDEFTVLEAARLILDLTGSASKIIFQSAMVDDPQQRRPDIARAQKHLGWSPKISLRQGLVETIEHFRQVAAGGPNLPKNLDAPDPDFRT